MVEAAIVEGPVFTLLLPGFADSRGGTFRFAYLFKVAGGIVRAAGSFGEHEDQLAEALRTARSEPSYGELACWPEEPLLL